MELAGRPLERQVLFPGLVLVAFAAFNTVQHAYSWPVVVLVPICLFVLTAAIDVLRARFGDDARDE